MHAALWGVVLVVAVAELCVTFGQLQVGYAIHMLCLPSADGRRDGGVVERALRVMALALGPLIRW